MLKLMKFITECTVRCTKQKFKNILDVRIVSGLKSGITKCVTGTKASNSCS